jgi:hypothetical protein
MPPEPPTAPPAGYGEPAMPPPGYGQPTAGESAYSPPGYGQSGIGQPGAGQPAAGRPGLQGFDPKTIDPLDWGIIGAGVIAFLFSLFDYFTYKVSFAGFSRSDSISAWHGVLAPIATLLAIAAAVLLAVDVIAKMRLAIPVRLVVLGAFALATLLLLLALFVVPGNTNGLGALGVKVNKGHGIGYWISLLAVLAGTGLSFKRFTDTGGKLPVRR